MKTDYTCVIISDTHGDMQPIREVIEREKPFDTLIHCGDTEGSLSSFLKVQQFGYLSVRGNCDMVSDDPGELVCNLGTTRIFVTHGHRYQVRYDDTALIAAGKRNKADVILYGHTHVPDIRRDEKTGILIINPGSLSRPRQYPREKTYAVLRIRENSIPEAEIRVLHKEL